MELFLYTFAAEDGNRSANHWRRTGRGLLRQRGVDCLIVDHAVFPRDKVCGGGLTPRG